MEIYLYKFSKPSNSLALPGKNTDSVVYDCQVKTPSAISNPAVQLTKSAEPLGYNYAYLPAYERYYFINDITYGLGVWYLDLSVDTLASFRADILASTQYVLRNTGVYNSDIVDDLYTTDAGFTYASNSAGNVIDTDSSTAVNYFNDNFSNGYFLLAVASANNSGVTYYNLTSGQFRDVVARMMAYVPSDFDDVSDGVAKSLFNPMQYILGCTWFPIDMHAGFARLVDSINFGGYSIQLADTVQRLGTVRGKHYYTTITVPKHPQATDRPYLKLSPYTQYMLVFEPFGSIPIDTTKLYSSASLRLDWYIDTYTGETELLIKNGAGDLIQTATANVGVSVPVSQLTVDYIGGATSLIGGVIDAVGSWGIGNKGQAIGSGATGIGNAIKSAMPQVMTKGASGSFTSYIMGAPVLHGYFTPQVDTDPAHHGRPLCENRQLSTLSGYTVCESAKVDYTEKTPLSYENDEVITALNTGVYIE